jgi:acyl carrier protein
MITEEQVRAAIRKAHPHYDVAALPAGKSFYEGGLDSLDHAEILLALSEMYGLNVPDKDVGLCVSIGGIVAYSAQPVAS